MEYIVINSSSPTAWAIHPRITLWRTADGRNFEEFKDGGRWLGDFGLGDYDADVAAAIWVKTFSSLEEASSVLPSEIVEHLAPEAKKGARLLRLVATDDDLGGQQDLPMRIDSLSLSSVFCASQAVSTPVVPEVSLWAFIYKVYPVRIGLILVFCTPSLLFISLLTAVLGWSELQIFLLVLTAFFATYMFTSADGIIYRNPFGSKMIKVHGPLRSYLLEYRDFLNADTFHYGWFQVPGAK